MHSFGPLIRITGEALQKKRDEKVPDYSDIFQSQLRIAKVKIECKGSGYGENSFKLRRSSVRADSDILSVL